MSWDRWAIDLHGHIVAEILQHGTEIHLRVMERPIGFTRARVRKYLEPLIEQHGFLTTRVTLGDEKVGKWLKKLGFQPTWSDASYQYYIMTELPYQNRSGHAGSNSTRA